MSTSNSIPPVDTRFQLGPIEEVHRRFLDHYGFLHFEQVLSEAEVAQAKHELAEIA